MATAFDRGTAVPTDTAVAGSATAIDLSSDLHILSEPTGIRAESIRVLRTHLIAQHLRDGRRSLAICSPAPQSGASYVAANLAVALAQTGVKTLLIDANLRRPGQQHFFTPRQDVQGLLQCLTDPNLSLGDVILDDIQPSLSLLYTGGESASAQELLAGAGFKSLIDSCVRDYDLTIVDSPAANTSADARRIAAVLRYALVVAYRNHSYVKDIRTLVGELSSDRVRVVGTYLNDR